MMASYSFTSLYNISYIFIYKCCIDVVIILTIFMAHQKMNNGCCMASTQVHHQSTTQNDYFINEMPQEKMDQLKVPKDQTLIVRLPSNTLLKYTSYKDVSILHFRMPADTRRAMFTFKALEESKSAFLRKCKPRDVALHLKASSYPVISPENITFPRNFLNSDQRYKIYNLQFKSDEEQQRITVDGPQVGNWFAVAFVSWTDPNNDRIEQQGLAASCDTLLLAEMSVSRFKPIIINNGQVHNSILTSIRNEEPATLSDSSKRTPTTAAAAAATLSTSTIEAVPNVVNDMKIKIRKRFDKGVPVQEELENIKNYATTKTTTTTTTASSTEEVGKRNFQNQQILTSTKTKPPLTNTTMLPAASSTTCSSTNCKSNNYNCTHIINNEIIYKFYVARDIGVATARIKFAHVCLKCPDVGFHIQADAFPSISNTDSGTGNANTGDRIEESNYIHSTIIKPNQTGEILIEFYVQPMAWHYALLQFGKLDSVTSVRNTLLHKNFDYNAFSSHKSLRQVGTGGNNYGVYDDDYEQSQNINDKISKPSETSSNATTYSSPTNVTRQFCKQVYELPFSLQIDFRQPFVNANNQESNIKAANDNNSFFTMSHTYSPNVSNKSWDNASNPWRPIKFRGMDFYPLLRQTYREFFMFDFDLVPDENGTVPPVLNLTGGVPAGFTFNVGEVYDIGGTLSFAVSMKHGSKDVGEQTVKSTPSMPLTTNERNGILAEKLVSGPPHEEEEGKSLPRSNQTIIVCMHLGEPGEPTWPDKCRYGRRLLPASSIVNNTDANTSTGLIHVPFPESGQWYVTMALYCHGAETAARVTIIDSVKEFIKKYSNMLEQMKSPCACSLKVPLYRECLHDPKCLTAMNETETLKIKECLMDSKCTPNHLEMTKKFEVHHRFATEQHFALDNCNTSVVFTISSSPCVVGRCGRFGRCYHYMSGGFVFSTCVCLKGYRGWDCTEDSQVPSSMSILLSSLLLTLSNLLFFPSIYMAVKRQYYTEGIIYFFAMFFSIFYHACDSGEDEYSFCLVKIGVLQFCDFYCGLLAIWVTLVAMSHIRQQFVSALHMLGAILLAFGTELNKQSLWVFLAPALTGICIISASWGLRCFKSRKWFPARKYLTVYMPMGTVLVMVGLVCYAFLQTKQNYHIVHSVWHMVMALSILCLLPSRRYFIAKC